MSSVTTNRWRCFGCEAAFVYDGDPVDAKCPKCSGVHLERFIHVEDQLSAHVLEHVGLVVKDPALPSSRKRRREVRSGRRLEGSGSGRTVGEKWVLDRDLNLYQERIIDVESGAILRDVDEPLDQHRGGLGSKRGKV